MSDREYQYCNGKRCLTRREAGEAVNAVAEVNHRHHSKKVPKRTYRCPDCGFWHLTSQADKTKRLSKGKFYND